MLVSAATAWEITTRFRLGKLPCVSAIAADLGAVLDAQGFIPLSISFIAQAMHDDMVLAPRTPGPC